MRDAKVEGIRFMSRHSARRDVAKVPSRILIPPSEHMVREGLM